MTNCVGEGCGRLKSPTSGFNFPDDTTPETADAATRLIYIITSVYIPVYSKLAILRAKTGKLKTLQPEG